MKIMKFLSLVTLLFCGFISSSQAQGGGVFNDTILVFRPGLVDIVGFEGFRPNDFFLITNRNQVARIPVARTERAGLPRRTRRIANPLLLEKDGKCYQLGATGEAGCGRPLLLWLDRNRDQQVQPRREVRAVCRENIEVPVTLVWREVPCR